MRPTATFCLACDTPITDTERGLSVAEPVAREVRARPWLVGVVVVGLVALIGGTTYGVMHYISTRHQHTEAHAAADARQAMTFLVRAESGDAHACRRAAPLLSGFKERQSCLAIVGRDPGAKLQDVHTDTAKVNGTAGSVRLRATVADDQGTHAIDDVLKLTEVGSDWHLVWDGTPPA